MLILFALAVIAFVLAAFNAQINTAAVKTAIRWEFLGVAFLIVALWILK